jgi:hypothetical protein
MDKIDITLENVKNIRSQILRKQNYKPYSATLNTGSIVLTDYDHFPYQRYYRGIPNSDRPIVAEREAGWRPIYNRCYKDDQKIDEISNNNFCFETACSTVYPCHPDYLAKYADRDSLNVMLNNECVSQYR